MNQKAKIGLAVAGTLVLGTAVYVVIKKRKGPVLLKLPDQGASAVVSSPGNPLEFYNPAPLVQRLHSSMKGLPGDNQVMLDRELAWYELSMLPGRDMVVMTYNDFNKKHFDEGLFTDFGTLTQWINDESTALQFGRSYKEAALNRLKSLNLP